MTDEKTEADDESPFTAIHERRQAERKVRICKVPEWGTKKKPLILYAYPLTINNVLALDGKYDSQTETNIMQIILQCMNGQGEPYFTLRNKVELLNEPADVIGRLLIQLNGTTSTFTEVLKKNND